MIYRRQPNTRPFSRPTSKSGRRRFLAGLGGAAVSLPFLHGLLGGSERAHAATRSGVYTVFFHQGNGVQQASRWSGEPERFWPRTEGAITRATLEGSNADRAVSELAPYTDKLLFLKGMQQSFGGGGCAHSSAIAECLTAARFTNGDGDARAQGESLDWRIAMECNEPGVEPLNLLAGRASTHRLSYSGPGELRGAQSNPLNVYMNMMGVGGDPDLANDIATRRRSVNDLVRGDMRDVLGSAALSDYEKSRLNQHFEAIRDIELTMACELMDGEVDALRTIGASAEDESNRIEAAKLHMSLIALTFACDLNSVATLQFGDAGDSTRFVIDGVRQNTFHRISHRVDSDGTDGPAIPNADMLHHKIDREFAKMFRHLLDRLSMYGGPSGGTLLDDSIAVWFSSLADTEHDRYYLPYIIGGSAGGFLRNGVVIEEDGTRVNRFYNTVLRAHGVDRDFGDASLTGGPIASIMA